MIKRIVHIGNPSNLSTKDRQLVITQGGDIHTVPLEDIGTIVIENREILLTSSVLYICDEYNISILHCDHRHIPVALTVPLYGHTFANTYLQVQLDATIPTRKQLWSSIIKSKIQGQIAVLERYSLYTESMYPLVDSIRSGDPDNIEARAAAKYWKILFGKDFVRIHAADGINSWLNYGYSILRATVARSVVAGGLHPSIGIWHANQYNYFNLVDDLIEPFRPLVDDIVKGFSLVYTDTILTTDMKKQLLSTLTYDLPYRGRMENISSIMTGYIASFRDGLVDSEKLDIPDIAKFLQNIEK